MALGDKEYNYNYYGVPDPARQWANAPGDPVFATMVTPNIWGYQPSGIYYDDGIYSNVDKNGKPLDDSIAVWRLPNNASFACNAFFSVDIAPTLGTHYDVNVENSAVSLICAAIDTTSANWGYFDRKCVERYAYDTVNTCNGPLSSLAYDINPSSVCLRVGVAYYNRATKTQSARSMHQIHTDITSDKIDLVMIQPSMYRGSSTARINDVIGLPNLSPPYGQGVMLADTSSNIPIPEGQSYLKSLIADTANGHNYRNDVIYRPFVTRYQNMLYNGTNDSIFANQLNIGFIRQLTANQIRSGAYTISGANKITGQIYRCNYDIKSFDDVVYTWENVIFDETNNVEIHNGLDISGYANSATFRFYTRIRIIDDKGNGRAQAIENAVRHEVAYIGFYFVSTPTEAQTAVLGSSGDGVGVYLPEIVDGVTTGRYFTGDDIKDVPYADSDSVSGFKYVPDIDEDGDFESITNTGTIGAGVSYYALNTVQVNNLATWLNTTYLPNDQDEFIQDFKGVNPSDYITTMMYYPFEIPYDGSSMTDDELVVGKLSTGVYGRPLEYTYGNLHDYGNYTFPSYGDFRDYLMKISVFVPFCGTLELDPRLWAGRTMNIKMDIDYPTGACTAYLYRLSVDGKWFKLDSISGTIGVPLPLSSVANGSYQVAITNLLASHKAAYRATVMSAFGMAGGVATAIGGAMTGNVKLALGGMVSAVTGGSSLDANVDKMDNIDYNIDHTAPTVSQISGGSPFINCGSDYRVAIFICTPQMLPGYNAGVYGKTTGYATCKQGTLSEVSKGFTRCASAELSGIACTSSERKMIFDSLQSGVYV